LLSNGSSPIMDTIGGRSPSQLTTLCLGLSQNSGTRSAQSPPVLMLPRRSGWPKDMVRAGFTWLILFQVGDTVTKVLWREPML